MTNLESKRDSSAALRFELDDNVQSLGARLDDLLASHFHSNRPVDRIWLSSDLPPRLQRCANKLPPGSEWRAHRDETRVSCVIARTHVRALPLIYGQIGLDVYFLAEDGAVYSAGVWEHNRQHGWWLDAVLDASYDCESGWWFGALVSSAAPTYPEPVSESARHLVLLPRRPRRSRASTAAS